MKGVLVMEQSTRRKNIQLKRKAGASQQKNVDKLFGFAPGSAVKAWTQTMLDQDGLPHVGRAVQEGDVIFAYHTVSADYSGHLVNRDGGHQVWEVQGPRSRLLSKRCELLEVNWAMNQPRRSRSNFGYLDHPLLAINSPRDTVRRGVCSQKWPAIDMPFSESGIQPDIIINPHAFPSRMTIGMFVESLAGKAGALHGLAQDSTPFRFDEDNPAADYFGHQLMKAGYNYHGNEPMYSGITGQELAADIYVGVVYYQRLRHMVNDKYQVRTTGPVVATTGQPIKGRKRGGGIRVGEMERDALLAHGTAFLLQDRLLNCSDYTPTWGLSKVWFVPVGTADGHTFRWKEESSEHSALSQLCKTPGSDAGRRSDEVKRRDMGRWPRHPVDWRWRNHKSSSSRSIKVSWRRACGHGSKT